MLKAASAAYAGAPGFEEAAEKGVDAALRFEAVGTELDGRRGLVGAALKKRQAIAACLHAMVRTGKAERKCLEKAVGALVHPLQHRRELSTANEPASPVDTARPSTARRAFSTNGLPFLRAFSRIKVISCAAQGAIHLARAVDF